jgi:tRNA threonylcarbamoyladenosine biosynthesis protein TsaB
LALDGATPRLAVALARLDAGGALREVHRAGGEEGAGQHARRLPDLFLEVCAEAECEVGEIGAWVVGLGPGSFTGLRTALATVKALAWAGGASLIGVGTLAGMTRDALRASSRSGEDRGGDAQGDLCLVPCLDARRGEVYAATFDGAGRPRPPLETPHAVAPERLLEAVASEGTVRLFGVGASAYEALARSPAFAEDLPAYPRAVGLLECALARLRAGDHDDPLTLLPAYVRRSEAERALDAGTLRIPGLTAPLPAGRQGSVRGREDVD